MMRESATLADVQWSALHRRRRIMAQGIGSTVAAAVKTKVGVAALAAALAIGGTAGTVAAAHQGAFGQQVKAQVQKCKDALAAGAHGIGDCVSDFASQHGQDNSQQHRQNNSSTHGKSDQSHGKNDQTHGNSGK
jgi:hypothetical protein